MTEALIVCNGTPPSSQLLHAHWNRVALRVAADGGANALFQQGLLPDVVVGDLDSLHPAPRERLQPEQLIHLQDQDTNDADKAIAYCCQQGMEQIHLLGAEGQRADQFLANLEVMLKYSKRARVLLWTERERCEFLHEFWEETLPVGTTVSLLPIFGGAAGIHTQGLAYALSNASLLPGRPPTGVSNQTTAPEVSVRLTSGQLLLTVAHPAAGASSLAH